MKSISELRQDIVSQDWVVIATGRAKRPGDFLKQKKQPFRQPQKACPFEILHADSLVVYSLGGVQNKKNWAVQVIPNKYPAFGKGVCALSHRVGPYQWVDGVGAHEVVVTQGHDRSFALMSDEEVELVIRAYQDRFLILKNDDCVEYISIFHNEGRQAGATISHPHSQIVALPVVPPDIARSIRGSVDYYHENRECVHCRVVRYERREKTRILYENEFFVVLAPYASKSAFELRIFPKKHYSHFETISVKERFMCANALRVALAKLHHGLKSPDYNFFIHTSPTNDHKTFHHYHWHLEIVPKTGIWAGFEIGTGIEISTIAPEDAAQFLRKIKIR